jgi:hypothetical protein
VTSAEQEPSKVQIENESTLMAALNSGINLFLGAGFSVLAKDEAGRPMPVGQDLHRELVREFSLTGFENMPLSNLCTVIEHTHRDALRSYLTARFRVRSYDQRYLTLDDLMIKSIFTTNIDNLPLLIYEKSTTNYLNDIYVRGPAFRDRQSIDIITLHGSILHPDRPYVFSTESIASAFGNDIDGGIVSSSSSRIFPHCFGDTAYKMPGHSKLLIPLPPVCVDMQTSGS